MYSINVSVDMYSSKFVSLVEVFRHKEANVIWVVDQLLVFRGWVLKPWDRCELNFELGTQYPRILWTASIKQPSLRKAQSHSRSRPWKQAHEEGSREKVIPALSQLQEMLNTSNPWLWYARFYTVRFLLVVQWTSSTKLLCHRKIQCALTEGWFKWWNTPEFLELFQGVSGWCRHGEKINFWVQVIG